VKSPARFESHLESDHDIAVTVRGLRKGVDDEKGENCNEVENADIYNSNNIINNVIRSTNMGVFSSVGTAPTSPGRVG